MNYLSISFWSGVLATGPMTLSLFKSYEALPKDQKSALPPATITKQITTSSNPDLAMASHFAYGVACAAIYSAFAKNIPASATAKGAAFGLGVWGASYLGWLPAFGFRSNAPKMTPERNLMMIGAHLVWGAALGVAEAQLRARGDRMLRGHHQGKRSE